MFKITLTFFIALSFFALFTTFSHSEYYQYTDANGKLRFTDDISNVPKSQREDIKKFKSVKTYSPQQSDTELQTESSNASSSSTKTNANEQSVGKESQAADVEIGDMHKRLNQLYTELEKERLGLEAQIPEKGATPNERVEYSAKVEALNARVKEYEKELTIFNEKMDAVNASKKAKSSSGQP
ncbi:MAG: DUF4124 domain-containing protein [Desulfamplus sp.]|nr:DUF4124 domain-containing protein [Desulfamplus sp.]